jgi:hypothetical protein
MAGATTYPSWSLKWQPEALNFGLRVALKPVRVIPVVPYRSRKP